MRNRFPSWLGDRRWRWVALAVFLLAAALVPQFAQPPVEAPLPPDVRSAPRERGAVEFHDLTIRDEQGRVAYRGSVDLSVTLSRIAEGKRLRYGNDGSTFENREGRLPKKKPGHYREYVHPTEGLPGPGPQRVVVGADGEAFYTPDHYQTFRPVRKAN